MKIKSILKILFPVFAATSQIHAADSLFLSGLQESQVIVNNRILAKVNGKAISVIDVMKKMDMLFYRQFPQYTSSPQARYQFYQANWKYVLSEIIDRELILADAQEMKVAVSAGDVRQEMETLFGPNIIANLDKVGLTFDEAAKMVLSDLLTRKMMSFRIQLKAINEVTPLQIRTYYENVAKDNIRDNEWIFNVITIRHRDSTKAAETANIAYRMLSEENVPLDQLSSKLNVVATTSAKQPSVTISEEYHTNEKELASNYKDILLKLDSGGYSTPIAQKSRSDNSTVFRIFYLKNMIPGGVIPFNELEARIKDKLVDEAMEKETGAYLARLRQHFDVQEAQLKELISSDFQPFMLK